MPTAVSTGADVNQPYVGPCDAVTINPPSSDGVLFTSDKFVRQQIVLSGLELPWGNVDGWAWGDGIAHLRVVTVLNARRPWLTVLLPQGEERFEPVVPFGWKLLTKNPKLICAGVDVF